jgi:sensor histidine kinase YesM
LNPHFLFNILNSVISLVQLDPPKAEQALIDLSAMLRYALASRVDTSGDEVTFREELRLAEEYLALEKLRLGDRLIVERDIDEAAYSLEIPSLTLQPLVENAVKHGLEPLSAGGKLLIRATSNEGFLHLEIKDNGQGCEPLIVDTSKGLGLATIKRRLQLYYRGHAKFSVSTSPEKGFSIHLDIPQDEIRMHE